MKKLLLSFLMLMAIGALSGETPSPGSFTPDTRISDVISHPAFSGYGHLLFPQDGWYSGETLSQLRLPFYSHIDAETTAALLNSLKERAESGERIFFDIYTEQEKREDPSKRDTGLFFFRGNEGERFAILSAGGAFAYVGAIHDSFPHAYELSKRGYNAFALIYRPGADNAMEDLARAVSFIFRNAEMLGVDTSSYSAWGGSAGARMAAWLGSYGPAAFGGDELPSPAAVIMQYTGLGGYSASDAPAFACVGSSDGIASWRAMKARIDGLKSLGIDAELHVYPGLGHGFGLGIGTAAEGWIDLAISFWERNMNDQIQ